MDIDQNDSAACSGIEEHFSALSINNIPIVAPEFTTAINNVFSNIPELEFQGVQQIRKLLSIELQPPIDKVINMNIVPTLIQMSYVRNELFAFEVCWILCNIASGDSSHTQYILKHKCLEFFDKVFNANPTSLVLKDQVTWAIGNIAGDCIAYRNLVLASELFEKVLSYSRVVILNFHQQYLLNCMWTLSNFVRGKPAPDKTILNKVLPVFLEAISLNTNNETLADILWGLSYITDALEDSQVFTPNNLSKIISCLKLNVNVLVIPACRTIGNIISNSSNSWTKLKQFDIINILMNLMNSEKQVVRREAAWILSNLCAESQAVITEVIEKNVYHKLYQLSDKEDLRVLNEIIWIISNTFSTGSSNQIAEVVAVGWLLKLFQLFSLIKERKMKIVILEGLYEVYSKVPGLLIPEERAKVCSLYSECNEDILMTKCNKILELFTVIEIIN